MSLLTEYILALSILLTGLLLLRYLLSKKNISSLQDLIDDKTKNIRRLHFEILMAEEKHRQYIATEFHDRVAQYLAMARNKTGLLKKQMGDTSPELQEIHHLIDISIKETRALIQELNPPILHESAFGPAIILLVHQICENNRINTNVNNLISRDQSENIGSETKTILFQSVREILNNIVKHAQAENVTVEVWSEKNYVWLKIADDGVGISANDQHKNMMEGGYGLVNIQNRLQQMNGHFEIHSEPGFGTTVTFGAPVQFND